MTHSHTHQGQSLVHDHDGGDKPHGYFQHSEDVGLPEPSSPVRSAGDAHEHDWPNAEQSPHDVCSICGKSYVEFHDELVANGIPIPYEDENRPQHLSGFTPEEEVDLPSIHPLQIFFSYADGAWYASVHDLFTAEVIHTSEPCPELLEALVELAHHLAELDEAHSVDFRQVKHCVSRLRRRVSIAEGLALSDIEGNDWDDYDDQPELPGEVLRDGLH